MHSQSVHLRGQCGCISLRACAGMCVAWAGRGRGGAAARNSMHGGLACVASRACAPSTRPYAPRWFFAVCSIGVVYGGSGDCTVCPGRPVSGLRAPRTQLFCPCSCSSPSSRVQVYRAGLGVQRLMMRRRTCGVLAEGRQGVSCGGDGTLRRRCAMAWRTSASVGWQSAPTNFCWLNFFVEELSYAFPVCTLAWPMWVYIAACLCRNVCGLGGPRARWGSGP